MTNKNNVKTIYIYVSDFPGVRGSFQAANVSWNDMIFKARDNAALIKPWYTMLKLKSSTWVFLLRKVVQNILFPISDEKRRKEKQQKSKETMSHDTKKKKTNRNKQTSRQRNYENNLLVADRISKCIIPNSHPVQNNHPN